MRKIKFVLMLITLLTLYGCGGMLPRSYKVYEKEEFEQSFEAQEGSYRMRRNQVILAKRDTKICAIKFKTFEDGGDGYSKARIEWQRYDLTNNEYKLSNTGFDWIIPFLTQ